MSKKAMEWLQFVVMAHVALLLLWLAFRGMDIDAIWNLVAQAHWGWVGVSVALTLLGHLSRARRWQLLIGAAGYAAGLWPCLLAMMTGYFSNLGIPRIGEANRCISLNRLTDAPVLALGGTVVAERAVDLLTFVVLLFGTFFWMGTQAFAFFYESLWHPMQALIHWKWVVAAVVGVLLLLGLNTLAYSGKKAGESRFMAHVRRWALEIWNGLLGALRLRGGRLLGFGLHTVAIWLSYYSAPLCTLLALDIPTNDLWGLAFYIFVFGSLSRTIPLPAGSAGAYHFIVTQWMVFIGYSRLEGSSVAVLNHAVQTLFYFVFGLLALLGFFVQLRIQAGQSQPTANNSHPMP